MVVPTKPNERTRIERANEANKLNGIDYQIDPERGLDAKAFGRAALKRWPKITAKLAE